MNCPKCGRPLEGSDGDHKYAHVMYVESGSFKVTGPPVPGEFRICRHFRVQDELSQSFDFLLFKRGNQIQIGLFKG
jgi:hypothetical protein